MLLVLVLLLTPLTFHLLQEGELTVRQEAWYAKTPPTFSNTLALVR